MALSIDDFLKLRSHLPIVDVRSEGEHADGHIPSSFNIPILNDAERIEVGTIYKQQGQPEAIRAGFRLVGPRLSDIVTRTEEIGSELLVHCWRGGMRSSNFCQFVGMAKVKTHQLAGGYKAYRAKAIESFALPFKLITIAGCTGSGKSEILRALKNKGEQVIDLELMASHKGSVFGGLMIPPQPTTEQFQNILFETIHTLDLHQRIWIEDEAIAIGKIFLPQGLWRQMQVSPVVEIEVNKADRIKRLVHEYGAAKPDQFLEAMIKITRKLGGQHFNAARDMLEKGDMDTVMDILLTYYDKAYMNNIAKKRNRIKQTLSWDNHAADAITDTLCNSQL